MSKEKYYWLNKDSRKFLEGGYLEEKLLDKFYY
jgi:hypothetical protein